MKKVLFVLIAICVIAASCKKDHKIITPVSTLQKVSFAVGFSQSTSIINSKNPLKVNSLATNSSTPDTALTNYISTLYYMVFDSAGNLIHNITQLSSDTAFGHYTDNLHTGKYTVAVAGCTGMTLVAGTLSSEYLGGGFSHDAFFERVTITVANAPLTQPISLNRITSKFIVNINDAIPANATYGLVRLIGVANDYFVGTDQIGTSVSNPYYYTIPATAAGTTNYQMSGIFLYMAPFTTDIEVAQSSDPAATVYGAKTVQNVTGQANKITILSGNLFGGSGGGGLQVVPDTIWNIPIIKTFP